MKTEKPKEIKLEDESSEKLALYLNQWYNTIMQCQQNILAANQILAQRQAKIEGK
jgi:flagellar biosynthesis/type III secretory pathway chaperone